MLKDVVRKYYFAENYNCAETIIRAGNEYYGLGLHDRDMIMLAAFGAGIQTGDTCGALLATASILSMKYVETRAHESPDIHAVMVKMTRRFQEKLGSRLCREVRPKFFDRQVRCLHTVEAACDALEEVIAEYEESKEQAAPTATEQQELCQSAETSLK